MIDDAAGAKLRAALAREVRNTLAHDYPDHPALQAAAWTRLRQAADELLTAWERASDGAVRLQADTGERGEAPR